MAAQGRADAMHHQGMQNAAAGELAERIQGLQSSLSRILALGYRFSSLATLLREQHPDVRIDAIDPNPAGESFALPYESGSYDLVVCNLMSAFYPLQAFAAESLRVLDENGVLMFSAFAPGSFLQLSEASRALEELEFTAVFSDMHSLGDLLLATGFVNPVVDAERCEYQYRNLDSMICEIADSGLSATLFESADALDNENVLARLGESYPRTADDSEFLHLSLEFLYGAAWKKPAGEASMNVLFHPD